MNNYVPEGLQEFTEYKNEFLRKIQKATAPYHEATMAVQKAMEPYYKATAAVQKAMEPYYKATTAVQKAMEPIYETQKRFHETLTAPYTIEEILEQVSKPYALSLRNYTPPFSSTLSVPSSVTKAAYFSSISKFREVQGLIRTINTFHLDESEFPSGAINDINSADIHTDTVDISENLANNIVAILKENDIFIEGSIPSSPKLKTISISTFKKYLEIIVALITIASCVYTVRHDYISDKANAEYQSQMLKEEHQQTIEAKKQTRLLQDIDDKLSQNNSAISTEKH